MHIHRAGQQPDPAEKGAGRERQHCPACVFQREQGWLDIAPGADEEARRSPVAGRSGADAHRSQPCREQDPADPLLRPCLGFSRFGEERMLGGIIAEHPGALLLADAH